MSMKRIVIIILLAFANLAAMPAGNVPDYRNSRLPAELRARDLLSRMSVEEKIGQIICPYGWPMYEKDTQGAISVSPRYRDFIDNMHGGMLWATFRADPWTGKTLENGLDPTLAARTYNTLQKYAVEHSRLGIPIILAEEMPHGHMAIGTTVFPTGLAVAASWSRELAGETGRVIAEEVRAQGGHIGYGPVIDLAREPRWSRVEETYGEDVCLTSALASAFVGGSSPKNVGWDRGIISTLKHFVAYGIPEGGHNGNQSVVGERDLHENFLPAFKAAIDAGALSVMTSYNSIDGIPATSNKALLTGLLREQWGFDGFVVSDLGSIDGIWESHHLASSLRQAGEMAIKAGVDVDLGARSYLQLAGSLADGALDMEELDRAVMRVLMIKFRLGLFDKPYIDETDADKHVRTRENMDLARRVAREGTVLLENNGILPLKKGMKIAVVGPNADNIYNQLGDYTAPQERSNVKTVLDGVRAMAGGGSVTYVKGCAIRDTAWNEIPEAVQAAEAADVVIAVVGGSSARDFQTQYESTGAAIVGRQVSDMESGEGFDRATLDLLGLQKELLVALKQTGTPLVVVYIEGRPLDKNWAKENADALLTMFYPGQEGGLACADILFGKYNPAGRLPVSVPRHVGQLPVYYNRKFPPGGNYLEMDSSPLYEFGYGLGYSPFSYSGLEIRDKGGNSFDISFQVTNRGTMDGDEVPQLYITDVQASTVRPVIQLRCFDRVRIPAGETKTLTFTLTPDDFVLFGPDMKPVVEPGEIKISVGASSRDIRLSGSLMLE